MLNKRVASYLEAPYVETSTKGYVDFDQKRGQSVAQAISQRHFTMAAALVGLKIGSAGTDFKHKLLLPSCRECIPDTE